MGKENESIISFRYDYHTYQIVEWRLLTDSRYICKDSNVGLCVIGCFEFSLPVYY